MNSESRPSILKLLRSSASLSPGARDVVNDSSAPIAHHLELAETGDRTAALYLIAEVVRCLREASPMNDGLRNYLVNALDRIIAGEDARKALRLVKKGSGRRRKTGRKDALNIAAAYALLVRRGFAKRVAQDIVLRAMALDARTLDRYRKQWSPLPESEFLLEALAEPIAAQIDQFLP